MSFEISYIIATRNRLPFLKITLEKLIGQLQHGEEIVVVDGNSDDGTQTYLHELYKSNKIHQYISEPDRNQAHGWNKAMLMAQGLIIKKIIDDDVFCYKSIRNCKKIMLENPEIDVIISNDLTAPLNNVSQINKQSRLSQFIEWKKGKVPSFTFGDVHMLIRRSSLSFLGLYNTEYVMMDWEYSLRISYLKAVIVFYTGYNALSVTHSGSVTTQRNLTFIKKQGEKAYQFYEYKGDSSEVSLLSRIKISIGKVLKGTVSYTDPDHDINKSYTYTQLYKYIELINQEEPGFFVNSYSKVK